MMFILLSSSLLSSIIFFIIGVLGFSKDYKNKMNQIFFVVCIILTWWAFTYALMISAPNSQIALYCRKASVISWSALFCCLLHSVLFVTKKHHLVDKWWKLVLLYLPGLFCLIIYAIEPISSKNFIMSNYGWIYISNTKNGLIYNCYMDLYSLSYLFMMLFYLFKWMRTTKKKREKKQATMIIYSFFCAATLGIFTDLILPVLKISSVPPLSAIFCIIPVITIYYSINEYKFLSLTPQSLAFEYIGIMREGLIILNENDEIQEINRGALDLLLFEEDEIKGQHVSKIIYESTNFTVTSKQYGIETNLNNKYNNFIPVKLSYSVLYDSFGEKSGAVMIFQDISEIKRFQVELENNVSQLKQSNLALNNEIVVRKEAEEKVMQLACYDYLTGLPNRRLFYERLEKVEQTIKKDEMFAILYLDLDMFKNINDTMGHQAGDELLKKVAKRLSTLICIPDTVARIGGDEFLILLQNFSSIESVEIKAKKIIAMIQKPFLIIDQLIYITTSIGISIYPNDGKETSLLIKNADISLYKAKGIGHSKYVICTQELKNRVIEEMNLTNQLYHALDRNELEIFYQPQVNIETKKIIGFEALLRWRHPTLGLICPNRFMQIAEKTGLIIKIGEWVLRTACRQNKLWQERGHIKVPIAVNLSVVQFYRNDLVQQIKKILYETGLKPSDLELEIKESSIMKEKEFIINTLEKIKEANVKIAIDDFGTEYSSLSYIKSLPINRVKIAKEFVMEIGINQKDESIIQMIVDLLHKLELDVIAEGVEKENQIEFLKRINCNQVQGFYYYKPMPANKIEELMLDSNQS